MAASSPDSRRTDMTASACVDRRCRGASGPRLGRPAARPGVPAQARAARAGEPADLRGTDERRAQEQAPGSSVEFAEHRNYTVGDDMRHIDWNVYGRLDKLFLKLFLEEEDLHVYALLDTSLSMDFGTPTKLRYGKQVAAALAFIGLVQPRPDPARHLQRRLERGLHGIRGRSQMWRVVQYLDQLEGDRRRAT